MKITTLYSGTIEGKDLENMVREFFGDELNCDLNENTTTVEIIADSPLAKKLEVRVTVKD